MRVLLVVLIASCAASPSTLPVDHPAPLGPAAPAVQPSAPAPTPTVVAPPVWDDAKVIAQSQALLAAIDKYDFASYEALVDPAVVNFEYGRTYGNDVMKRIMTMQLDRKLPARTRTCDKQRVLRSESTLTYVDRCAITLGAHDDVPTLTHSEHDVLVWALHAGQWKVAYRSLQSAGLESEREMWNETYRSKVHFKTTANQHLVDTVKGRKPGTALDVAMGQGRNAVFLATQGWKVTGVDISDEGMKIAQANAAKEKRKLETINADMTTFDYGKERWDLVTLIYASSNHAVIEKIKPSIRKGGLFVVEFFAKESTAGTGIGGFAPGELAALFADGTWTILKDEVVEDVADWGLKHTKVVRFTAEKKKK